jgi:pilus assembly protein CpaD
MTMELQMKPYAAAPGTRGATMLATQTTVYASPLRRVSFALAVTAMAGLLQACGTRDGMNTGAIPDDYRTRHPITLNEAEHTIDIPVSSGDSRLTTPAADNIRGFVSSYKGTSTGIVQIQLPSGSPNAAAASRMGKQIRTILTGSGVPAGKIVETVYAAGPQGDAAPIRLSYVAVTAMTGQCGEWPEDLTSNTSKNRNWHNFGCATQNNLAAQIANPMDLVAPRGMTPIDAERRSVVIDGYRNGDNTASAD